MDDNVNDTNKDNSQDDLEAQIDKAVTENDGAQKTDFEEKTSKEGEGASPDLGTAKEQMNREEGIEIL